MSAFTHTEVGWCQILGLNMGELTNMKAISVKLCLLFGICVSFITIGYSKSKCCVLSASVLADSIKLPLCHSYMLQCVRNALLVLSKSDM